MAINLPWLVTQMTTFLDSIFFEDYNGASWAISEGETRRITWSIENYEIQLPNGNFVNVTGSLDNYVGEIGKAFEIWDEAIEGINFERTNSGNSADITIAATDIDGKGGIYGLWNYNWDGNKNITEGTIRFDSADLESEYFLTTAMHEIGNILGLGDLRVSGEYMSVQEDPFPEIFNGAQLWDYDTQMINTLYPVSTQISAINGTNGNDDMYGTSGNDELKALEGNDRLETGAGDDLIYGNQGEDTILAGLGDDFLYGGQDTDILYGNQGSDQLYGHLGADVLYGGQDADTLYGNQGSDYLYGHLGADVLYGGQDDDTLYGNQGSDYLYGNLGADVLYGGQDNDWLHGGQDNDKLWGNIGADCFFLSQGEDQLMDFNSGEGDWIYMPAGTTFNLLQEGSNLLVEASSGSLLIVNLSIDNFNTSSIVVG